MVTITLWTIENDNLQQASKLRLMFREREHFLLNRTMVVIFDTFDMKDGSQVTLTYEKSKSVIEKIGANFVRKPNDFAKITFKYYLSNYCSNEELNEKSMCF